MAVNQLAAAGFTKAYNIVDGIEGDTVDDPESVFHGKRMKNGWKNSAPWVYGIDPEKIIIEEGAISGNAGCNLGTGRKRRRLKGGHDVVSKIESKTRRAGELKAAAGSSGETDQGRRIPGRRSTEDQAMMGMAPGATNISGCSR